MGGNLHKFESWLGKDSYFTYKKNLENIKGTVEDDTSTNYQPIISDNSKF